MIQRLLFLRHWQGRLLGKLFFGLVVCWLILSYLSTFSRAVADGLLSTVLEDVRQRPSPESSSRQHGRNDNDRNDNDHFHFFFHSHGDDDLDTFWAFVLTSPIWAPHAAVGDDFSVPAYFPRFPYQEDTYGYMMPGSCDSPQRRWSARLRAEYSDNFDDLQRIGGHLLLSTSSRWGLDTEMNYLKENLPGVADDRLWLGDCNIVFRFAQSERMQWRTGAGFNWLDDPDDTDFGFNFTYGVDFFPQRPWVVSATIDWGTLGHAGLFRFRTTTGVVFHGLESYVGYEYLDIGRSQTNSLIAGVRFWF